MAQEQQKTKTKKQKLAPVSRPAMLSQEKIVDSDSDSPGGLDNELRIPSPKAPAPIKKSVEKKPSTNGSKHKTPVSSSDEETAHGVDDVMEYGASEEELDNDEIEAVPPKTAKRPAPIAEATPPPRKKLRPTPAIAIAPKPFKPPHGFEKTTLSASDYAASSSEFLTEDLTRKQIWHITAPASVNITDIKPFDIQDVRSGKPIFSKNGINYGFLAGSYKTEKLLLASGEDVEYAPAKVPISGTYHLREISRSKKKGETDTNKENSNITFAARSIVASRTPREQPAGLRMRYQPYGSAAASKFPGTATSPPTFRMVPDLPESQLDKRTKKNAKKEKNSSHEAMDSLQDFDPMDLDPIPNLMVKNPDSGKPSGSVTQMVDKVFEAATETPSQETKRKKKKKHRILEETHL